VSAEGVFGDPEAHARQLIEKALQYIRARGADVSQPQFIEIAAHGDEVAKELLQ
jgi:hypothetical protein